MNDIINTLRKEHNVVILGTSRDDGENVGIYTTIHFSLDDISITLVRFLEALGESDFEPNVIVGADEESVPLVWALGELLDCEISEPDDLTEYDNVLIVQALLTPDKPLTPFIQKVKEYTSSVMVFVLHVSVAALDKIKIKPSFIGVVSRAGTVPWQLINRAAPPEGKKKFSHLIGAYSLIDLRTPNIIADDIVNRVLKIQGIANTD